MQVIDIELPVVGEREVGFAWTVTPATPLYERTSFTLRFPTGIDVAAVPPGLWLRLALMVLHPHWPLLRPCRVRLPVGLEPGEAETWLRLTDAAVATLEAHAGGSDTERKIEITSTGPRLGLSASRREAAGDGVVSLFSGGRDGLTQAAMLCELGHPTTLVTVTAPCAWDHEHEAARRRQVMDEVARRRPVELVEVHSDLREAWNNSFAVKYAIGINELTDILLWLAGGVAVAAARGVGCVMMASEAEVQQNDKPGGMVVQSRHFGYSAVTHHALGAVIAPAGISIRSLTNALRQFQVQRLLSVRYADLRDLQYSCWNVALHQAACSQCVECRGIGLNLMASGVSPQMAGIDLAELLVSNADWEPGSRYLAHAANGSSLPRHAAGRAHEMQEIRCLVSTPRQQVARMLDDTHTADKREQALAVFETLCQRASAYELEPEPGYKAGYLELLEEPLRSRVRTILDEHLTPAPPESYAGNLANTKLLSKWITAPLRTAGTGPAPRVPTRTSDVPAELIPGPDPELVPGEDGRMLRVAETLLDGNELAYVSECVRTNWVSSAGSFVRRLEECFAEAVGCRYAIPCSSGTAALHLALAASGIGAGDEVMVPAFTMIATANAARYVGADPVLIDADPRSWNLDPRRLRDKLTRRTRAIVAVHTYGQPAAMDELREFATRNRLILIEDAAEAHGARYQSRPAGSLGDVAAFSLYGNKILTAGEGGIVSTNDPRIAAVARELRDHAFSPDRHFWHRRLGFNYRMTNLQAAVALAQTERLDELVARRADNARRYHAILSGIDGLTLQPQVPGGVSWMFGVVVGPEFGCDRDELRRRLAAKGVETRTFFVPLHVQPIYQERFAGQRYPTAEMLGARGLYLPSGPTLSDDDIAYVGDVVRQSAYEDVTGSPSSL
ncbi:MAG: DegT/DnrJ/EryC1/StrS family aminotransferase [Solirubrobacteraceae bacterium]